MLISFVLWPKEITRFCADEGGGALYRVPTRFGKVWKSMEFDLSIFQVWKSMEKIDQSMEKYLCFQTIVPRVF